VSSTDESGTVAEGQAERQSMSQEVQPSQRWLKVTTTPALGKDVGCQLITSSSTIKDNSPPAQQYSRDRWPQAPQAHNPPTSCTFGTQSSDPADPADSTITDTGHPGHTGHPQHVTQQLASEIREEVCIRLQLDATVKG
jgi:hypothetical protein